MPETVTLTLPDSVFQPLKRTAQAVHQPIEELLVTALQSSLPTLQGLPDEVIANLTTLETLDNEALWQVMKETVPSETQADDPTPSGWVEKTPPATSPRPLRLLPERSATWGCRWSSSI